MKLCCAIVIVGALLAGCGGGGANGETDTSADTQSQAPAKSQPVQNRPASQAPPPQTTHQNPRLDQPGSFPLPALPPNRGPVKKLYIKDLKVGKGPVARWGDRVKLAYVGVYWKSGKPFTRHWDDSYEFELAEGPFGPGWPRGIRGMRVGGRREIRIPKALLADGGQEVAYVLHLREVQGGTGQ